MIGGIVERRTTGVVTSSPNFAQEEQTARTVLSIATLFVRGTSAPHNSQITKSSPQRLNKKWSVYRLRLSPAHRTMIMDEDQIREFSEKLSERIASLEDRNDKLLENARRVEGERRYAETELGRGSEERRGGEEWGC